MSQFLFKAKVYFNRVKPLVEFRLPKDTTGLVLLRSKLNNMLPDTKNRKVSKNKFLALWIDIDGRVKYDSIELKSDEKFKVMRKIYHLRLTKGPIEFDATITRFVNNIIKMLKCQE